MANKSLPSWAKEDEHRTVDSIVQELVSRGVSDSSIWTNGYVFDFEYKGRGVSFCDQSTRFVGSVYASFQEMEKDFETDRHTIGSIYAEKGSLVANVSVALEQVEAGGLQDEDKYDSHDDYDSGSGRDFDDESDYSSAPATCREDEGWRKTPSEARRYANERNESGTPRWMEPFAKYDLFGKPTVFHPDFGRRSRR